MKQQTAVEFLVETLDQNHAIIMNYVDLQKLIEQAKEMEKQQIEDANIYGWREALDGSEYSLDTEQYYNKTFKSE